MFIKKTQVNKEGPGGESGWFDKYHPNTAQIIYCSGNSEKGLWPPHSKPIQSRDEFMRRATTMTFTMTPVS